MVVESLDTGYLCLFLGLRFNELVTRKLARAGFLHTRESHGYVIQHLIESSRSITELAARLEVSQQAASKTVGEMVALGILELTADERDRRARKVRLSARTWDAVRLSRAERRRLDRHLERKLGTERLNALRSTLTDALGHLGGTERIATRRVRMPT